MTIAVWPSQLPKPEKDTWQASRVDARVKRTPDSGPPGSRRRFSSVAKNVTLSIVVGRNLKAVFDNFFQYTTSEGSTLFYMPDPTTDGWPLLLDDGRPMLLDDGRPLLIAATWLCQFGDSTPVEAVTGIEFRLTFSVVVMP